MPGISRRLFSRWLLAAPALPAAALAGVGAQDPPKPDPPKPSPFAACVAASDPALPADDRARVEKAIATLEQSLSVVRNFKLPLGANPAFRFSPLLSRRRS